MFPNQIQILYVTVTSIFQQLTKSVFMHCAMGAHVEKLLKYQLRCHVGDLELDRKQNQYTQNGAKSAT